MKDTEFEALIKKFSKAELSEMMMYLFKRSHFPWTQVIYNVVVTKIQDEIDRNIEEASVLYGKWQNADMYNTDELYEAISKNHKEYERLNKRDDYISDVIFSK